MTCSEGEEERGHFLCLFVSGGCGIEVRTSNYPVYEFHQPMKKLALEFLLHHSIFCIRLYTNCYEIYFENVAFSYLRRCFAHLIEYVYSNPPFLIDVANLITANLWLPTDFQCQLSYPRFN